MAAACVSMARLNIARHEYRSVAGRICEIVREVGVRWSRSHGALSMKLSTKSERYRLWLVWVAMVRLTFRMAKELFWPRGCVSLWERLGEWKERCSFGRYKTRRRQQKLQKGDVRLFLDRSKEERPDTRGRSSVTCKEARMLLHGKMGSFVRFMLFIKKVVRAFSSAAILFWDACTYMAGGFRFATKILDAKTSDSVR